MTDSGGREDPVRPATLSDVARAAGVSVTTASRILNGGVRGSRTGRPELRERVLGAADRMSYAPTTAAQTVKGIRSRTVALMVSDVHDFGSARILSGAVQVAEDSGLSLSVRATYDDPAREIELLRTIRSERHRAVVLATSRSTDVHREAALDAELQQLRNFGAKVVLIGDNDLGHDTVTVDNRDAAARFAMALVNSGARRFAVITGPASEVTARDRSEGFLFGLRMADPAGPVTPVIHEPFTRNGGYDAIRTLGAGIADIDVVAAMSDAMAVGAMAALHELGISVPGSVMVTGFDRASLLPDILPRYDAVQVPLEELGAQALRLCFEDSPGPRTVRLRAVPIVNGIHLVDA